MSMDDAELRRKAAQRLRSLAEKQTQLSTGFLDMMNNYAVTTTTMFADAVQSGKLEPARWLSSAFALVVESMGAGLDQCLGFVTPGSISAGQVQIITFTADDDAAGTAGFALSNATMDQFDQVECGNLTLAGGAAAAAAAVIPVNKTKLDERVLVDVRGLQQNGGPTYPRGVYTGTVTLTPPGEAKKTIALVTLIRV